MEERIANFLLRCGFSPKHYGYKYLKKAILLFIESDFDVRILGQKLYAQISLQENDKQIRTIEKNITCAIEWAYLKGDVDFLESEGMFSSRELARPTNNEFIALSANKVYYGEF